MWTEWTMTTFLFLSFDLFSTLLTSNVSFSPILYHLRTEWKRGSNFRKRIWRARKWGQEGTIFDSLNCPFKAIFYLFYPYFKVARSLDCWFRPSLVWQFSWLVSIWCLSLSLWSTSLGLHWCSAVTAAQILAFNSFKEEETNTREGFPNGVDVILK